MTERRDEGYLLSRDVRVMLSAVSTTIGYWASGAVASEHLAATWAFLAITAGAVWTVVR